jgi:hypothetical protein
MIVFLLQFDVANDGDFTGDPNIWNQKNRLKIEPSSSKIEQQKQQTSHHHKSLK